MRADAERRLLRSALVGLLRAVEGSEGNRVVAPCSPGCSVCLAQLRARAVLAATGDRKKEKRKPR